MSSFKYAAVLAILMSAPVTAAASEYVEGHFRYDGTYVQPHYRSSPNGSRYDNYSSRGNVNPYTGNRGTVNPYAGDRGRANPHHRRHR